MKNLYEMDAMDAITYLDSLKIGTKKAETIRVGRLSIKLEFYLNGNRGLVVQPKKGGISDRYMELLAAEDVAFVIIDTSPTIQIYGKTPDNEALEPLYALPIENPTIFPPSELFHVISNLTNQMHVDPSTRMEIVVRLICAKIIDETNESGWFRPELVRPTFKISISDMIKEAGFPHDKLSGRNNKVTRAAAAILAGFRLKPDNPFETASVLQGLCQIAGKQDFAGGGLPALFSFAFSGSWQAGRAILVASQCMGSQLLPLVDATKSVALLPTQWLAAKNLLEILFPSTLFKDDSFLDWKPDTSLDRIIVVPPFGATVNSTAVLKRFKMAMRGKKRLSRVAAEILYIEHALNLADDKAIIIAAVPEGVLSGVSHSGFRSWVLEHARLHAVISLPPATCFTGASIRCSLIILQKIIAPSAEYPILMMEITEDDLESVEKRQALQSSIDDFIQKEIS